MSIYLELPDVDKHFPFRSLICGGDELCYPHWHKEIEMIYVTKGRLNLGINDTPIRMEQGEVQFINGGDVHYFLASPESERVVLQFDLSLFQELAATCGNDFSLREVFTAMEHSSSGWPRETAGRIISLIESIYEEDTRRGEGYAYLIKARLFELLTVILREVPRNNAGRLPKFSEDTLSQSREMLERLERIFIYVEQHYQEPITLNEVARHMGFSPYYFTKLFKKHTGMTFVAFLNEYRLNKAKWILLNEDLPMSAVAESAGFGSVKTFHHFFKSATGISPLKYHKTIFRNNRARMQEESASQSLYD
ncbi:MULTISPECIES: AraC family transcriptional regulator [unclassified Paenibacillus]|uniref:helix-turn-helix transcriptional regulator n=1 Tax=unclassified Paenibacillus TaxID=185978 RepID=UPI002404D472|nr:MULTISPECIES: AraC family transcriptional regulator [unclassified Paenibacillus]MDF9842136.1 AraC-like DNA-binding protein [Paenibacillus sp. PastF-2]MDF9848610.1 AraC-like DNA-binding protein [Paenibacillus sp. PastM-2]MDF9855179.1 AraC-like DNA-binding protein [Paenibacillus sp. PastF-1]MDH6480449.1 AraC-like DNA-binding protein [Paenibacillus sp. PastH-2]MDH6507877.1 AraC-like DNA-binding protein [Paenibacillus sp. PastM-3]